MKNPLRTLCVFPVQLLHFTYLCHLHSTASTAKAEAKLFLFLVLVTAPKGYYKCPLIVNINV